MTTLQQTLFPTLQNIMDLARAYCNDMYTGTGGQNGRILTNDAPFTIPYINSAFRTIQRKLRGEGCTFPIQDNVILFNMTAVPVIDTAIQVYIDFTGYFDGQTLHPTPKLPPDMFQPYRVWSRASGSGLDFFPMTQPGEGLQSILQGPWLRAWEWRNYKLYFNGSTKPYDLRLRYQSGQLPFNAPPANFLTTQVGIIDCEEAMACDIAVQYGGARGADTTKMEARRDGALEDMVTEWVRRSQTVVYNRPSYQGGGSNSGQDGGNGGVGQSGIG